MANYNGLKSSINNNIYENQTQQITGTVLNAILNEMVTTLGAGYQFAGVAYVGMIPAEPDGRIFYLAGEGIYTSFDGIQVPQGKLGILKWDSRWHLETIDGLGGGANLTGYVTVASTDDLPDEGVATLGYLCGTNLYLYVGEGGDTKEGKYQNCGSFRGPQGDSVQDVEQTQTSHENGGVNKIKFTLSNGQAYEFQVRNGTTSTGLFPTLADLQAAYPTPVVGQYAFVGSGFPADIYVCTTAGAWTDSGEDYDGDNVDLTDYATKAEVNELELKVYEFAEKGSIANETISITGGQYSNILTKIVSGASLNLYITPNGTAETKVYGINADDTRTALTGYIVLAGNKAQIIKLSPASDYKGIAMYFYSGYTANSASVVIQNDAFISNVELNNGLETKADAGVENVAVALSYARFSVNNGKGVYAFPSAISLSHTDDSVEIEMRYYGDDLPGYTDKAYILGNNSTAMTFGLRDVEVGLHVGTGDSWIYWPLPSGVSITDFHTYKLKKTATGFSLYIDGTLVSNKTYSGSNTFAPTQIGLSSTAQKVDVRTFKANIGGVEKEYSFFWDGGTNVAMRVDSQDAPTIIEPKIEILKYDSANFYVRVHNSAGAVVTYRFVHCYKKWDSLSYLDGDGQTQTKTNFVSADVWENDFIFKGSNESLAQGNANFIFERDGNPNYEGSLHGNEVMKFCKFFADGIEIDPMTLTGTFIARIFRFMWKSDVYSANPDGGNAYNGAYPDFDTSGNPIVDCEHWIDGTINTDNEVKIDNRLMIRRNNFVFDSCFGAMLQCNYGDFANAALDDPNSSVIAVASDGTTTVVSGTDLYANRSQYANKMIYFGGGFSIVQNMDVVSTPATPNVRLQFYEDRLKTYFRPVKCTYAKVETYDADVFNNGDMIRVLNYRKIDIKG